MMCGSNYVWDNNVTAWAIHPTSMPPRRWLHLVHWSEDWRKGLHSIRPFYPPDASMWPSRLGYAPSTTGISLLQGHPNLQGQAAEDLPRSSGLVLWKTTSQEQYHYPTPITGPTWPSLHCTSTQLSSRRRTWIYFSLLFWEVPTFPTSTPARVWRLLKLMSSIS